MCVWFEAFDGVRLVVIGSGYVSSVLAAVVIEPVSCMLFGNSIVCFWRVELCFASCYTHTSGLYTYCRWLIRHRARCCRWRSPRPFYVRVAVVLVHRSDSLLYPCPTFVLLCVAVRVCVAGQEVDADGMFNSVLYGWSELGFETYDSVRFQ